MKYILAIVILLFINVGYAENLVIVDNLDVAKHEAKETNSTLVVIFSAEWCKYCTILKSDIENNPNDLKNHVICIIDYDSQRDLVDSFNVKTIPDSIILDPIENKIVKRKRGYSNFTDYKKWLGL